MTELFIVITVIAVALIFDYTNGFHDSANAMAGPIATGAMRPRTAVILGAFLNLVGAVPLHCGCKDDLWWFF